MAEIKMITENRLRYLSGMKRFNIIYLEKDFFLTLMLHLLKDVEGICFKGGTALNKIFLNHSRLSEDLDFTCNGRLSEIKNAVKNMLDDNKDMFPKSVFENTTSKFFRLKILYNHILSPGHIILDVNAKASILLPPSKQLLPHFYEEIPTFKILTFNVKEIVAEKVRALITRNQPRDYFDVFTLLNDGYKIDLNLVKKKLKEAGEKFDTDRIFRNTNKIYSKWQTEIAQLTNEYEEFTTVINRLQKEFKYKM